MRTPIRSLAAGAFAIAASIGAAAAGDIGNVSHNDENFINENSLHALCPTKGDLGEYMKAIKDADIAYAASTGCELLQTGARIRTLEKEYPAGPDASWHVAHVKALDLTHFGTVGWIHLNDKKGAK